MGYRSDVALVLNSNGVKFLQASLDEIDVTPSLRKEVEKLFEVADVSYVDSDTNSILWYWSYLKWYDEYRDVEFIENLLLDLDNKDYLFVRIGEYSDDIEERGSYYSNPFDVGITRSIQYAKPA